MGQCFAKTQKEYTVDRNVLKFEKKVMASSLIQTYDVTIVILMPLLLKNWKLFSVSLFLNGLS